MEEQTYSSNESSPTRDRRRGRWRYVVSCADETLMGLWLKAWMAWVCETRHPKRYRKHGKEGGKLSYCTRGYENEIPKTN